MKEGIKNMFCAIYSFVGCYLIGGTFIFQIMPAWGIALHIICVLAFIASAPVITKKLFDEQ